MSGLNGLTNQEMLEELNESKYTDSDGDGIADENDAFPNDSSASTDTDLDGMPDVINTPSFITDGLIGYWKLDEASGNVIDSSNYNHTSTIYGNVTYEIPAEYGTGIHFDGDDDYIEINSNDAFNNSNLSISFWVNFSDLPDSFPHTLANTGLVCKGDWADEAWCIDLEWSPWTTPNLGFRFWHRHAGIGMTTVKTTGSIVTGEWIHVAATYDGSTSEIYLNGQIENSTSTPFGDLISSSDPIHIATRTNTTGYPIHSINGSMDDVRIYDNGFNSSEVGYLYNLLVEDEDDDNDGTPDIDDAFPLDPTEDSDFDSNGVGDNAQFAEFDLDGDGVWDEVVNMPGFMRGLANTSTIIDYSMQTARTCLILNNGSMMCWGTGIGSTPAYATLPTGRTAVEVSMGQSQFCVLLDDQSVACWGGFFPDGTRPGVEFGTYGGGDSVSTVPTIVHSLPKNAVSVSVADGFNQDTHICSIMENGSVYCWGSNQNGQLGLGFRCVENNTESPANNLCYSVWPNEEDETFSIGNASQMILPEGRTAVGMHLGRHYSLIVLDNHSMICYGQNCGSSGDHENFVYVGGTHKITAVIASHTSGHSPRILTSQGIVETLDAYFIPHGNGPQTYNQEVGPFSEIGLHCASLKNGSVACNPLGTWTSHPAGSEALGHTGHWYTPPHNLSAGGVKTDHHKACAILSNGDLECWGYNGGPIAGIGIDYYCDGENNSNGCDSANFVLNPRRIILPRPLMVQEMDLDGDGISKLLDRCADGESGWTSNSSTDFDGDGCRDTTEDDDDDGDGIIDIDSDCDGLGNNVDPDDDNDGVSDDDDAFPLNPYESNDFDNDGIGDNCDCDTDGDGMPDMSDPFPFNSSESYDSDGDGIGDNSDDDDDDDGTLDVDDAFPLDPTEDTDTDGDGVGDNADDDADGDGVSDSMDYFPQNPDEWLDTDLDGIGDNADPNDDNDGALDQDDAFPLDPNEDSDTDGDGVGDNADDDADGDGEVDGEEAFSIGSLDHSDSLRLSLVINLLVIVVFILVLSSKRENDDVI